MAKKWIEIDDNLLKRFEKVAVAKFGIYGAITKGANEAIEEWVKRMERYD